jgi:hypothetical protein
MYGFLWGMKLEIVRDFFADSWRERKSPEPRNLVIPGIESFRENTRTYRRWQTPNWLQARWEYVHFHPGSDLFSLHQIGIWENDGEIVGADWPAWLKRTI